MHKTFLYIQVMVYERKLYVLTSNLYKRTRKKENSHIQLLPFYIADGYRIVPTYARIY